LITTKRATVAHKASVKNCSKESQWDLCSTKIRSIYPLFALLSKTRHLVKEPNVLSVKVSKLGPARLFLYCIAETHTDVNLFPVRFLDANGRYIGPVMVAKESRFAGEYYKKGAFHMNFMRTQNIASSFARRFNDALDEAAIYFDEAFQACIRGLPRIRFIEPMVVELMENEVEKNILIERYLEGDYKKVCSKSEALLAYLDLQSYLILIWHV
jgi:hypothetical protein